MRDLKFEYGFQSNSGIVKKVYSLSEIPNIKEKCDVWNVLPIIYVREFTGLKDKNGVDIYEGDIYECMGIYYVVTFKNGAFCGGLTDSPSAPLGWDLEEGIDGYTGDMTETTDISFINVIGNIHENKDLV